MPYDRTPTLSQTISSGLSYADNAVDIWAENRRRKTQSDILLMQAQFEADQHKFLMELQASNNYQDYQYKLDDFYQKIESSMSQAGSPYYCDNGFTEKKMTEHFLGQKVALQNKVNELTNQKMIAERMTNDQKLVSLLIRNDPGQIGVNNAIAVHTQEYQNGDIDYRQYLEAIDNDVSAGTQKLFENYYTDGLEDAILRGLTAEEYTAEIIQNHKDELNIKANRIPTSLAYPGALSGESFDNFELSDGVIKSRKKQEEQNTPISEQEEQNTPISEQEEQNTPISEQKEKLDVQSVSTIPVTVNNDAALKKIKELKEKDYNARVTAMQQQTHAYNSQLYAQMENDSNLYSRYNKCQQAINYIEQNETGLKISANERISDIKLFKAELLRIDGIWDKNNKKSSKGNKTSGKTLESVSVLLNGYPDVLVDKINKGEYSIQEAVEGFTKWFMDETTQKPYKETSKFFDADGNITDKSGLQEWQTSYSLAPAKEIFKNTLLNSNYGKHASALRAKINEMQTFMTKNNTLFGADAAEWFSECAIDLIMNVKNGVDLDTVFNDIEKIVEGIALINLDKLYNTQETKKDLGGYLLEKQKAIDIDTVFIDSTGKQQWLGNTKESVDIINEQKKTVLAKMLGIERETISSDYEKSQTLAGLDYDDITPNAIYKTVDGKYYRYSINRADPNPLKFGHDEVVIQEGIKNKDGTITWIDKFTQKQINAKNPRLDTTDQGPTRTQKQQEAKKAVKEAKKSYEVLRQTKGEEYLAALKTEKNLPVDKNGKVKNYLNQFASGFGKIPEDRLLAYADGNNRWELGLELIKGLDDFYEKNYTHFDRVTGIKPSEWKKAKSQADKVKLVFDHLISLGENN